nr:ferritin-like domain-containing protein [Weissella cibaria]
MLKKTSVPKIFSLVSKPQLRRKHLVDGYRYLENLYQHGIEVSDVEKDFSTQDIFIGLKTAIEKKIWMIQAELGSAPEIDE